MSVSPNANDRIRMNACLANGGQARMSLEEVRNGRLFWSESMLRIGSWNVEHLTPVKFIELQNIMIEKGLSILCLQETHIAGADSYISTEGFLIILSGGPVGVGESAGVGFIVAPTVRRSIITYREHNARMASIKLRVHGGQLCLVSAYAPHGGLDYALRWSFFDALSVFVDDSKYHGPTFIVGDLHSRMHRQRAGEDALFSKYAFCIESAQADPLVNRNLLLEYCSEHSLVVVNIVFEKPDEELVTYCDWGINRFADINYRDFSQLDNVLMRENDMEMVRDIFSDRAVVLQSQHFSGHCCF